MGYQDRLGSRASLDHLVDPAWMDNRVYQGIEAPPASRDHQDLQGHPEPAADLEAMGHQAHQVLLAHQVRAETKRSDSSESLQKM